MHEGIDLLAELYPRCFCRTNRRPLKIGICEEVISQHPEMSRNTSRVGWPQGGCTASQGEASSPRSDLGAVGACTNPTPIAEGVPLESGSGRSNQAATVGRSPQGATGGRANTCATP